MSARSYVDVWCDGPGFDGGGCMNWADGATGKTASEARARAQRDGWTRKGRKDFCPDCSKALNQDSKPRARQALRQAR